MDDDAPVRDRRSQSVDLTHHDAGTHVLSFSDVGMHQPLGPRRRKMSAQYHHNRRSRCRSASAAVDVTWALDAGEPTPEFWRVLCSQLVPKWMWDSSCGTDAVPDDGAPHPQPPSRSSNTPHARAAVLHHILSGLPCARSYLAKAIAELCLDYATRYISDQSVATQAITDMRPEAIPSVVSDGVPAAVAPAVPRHGLPPRCRRRSLARAGVASRAAGRRHRRLPRPRPRR